MNRKGSCPVLSGGKSSDNIKGLPIAIYPDRPCPGGQPDRKGDVRLIGKYSVIYADPPWRYQNWKGQGVAERHYPTMTLEDIKALPVAGLAGKDCVLFLWATCP